MSKTYKNPPLKEAVCEFRFELNETAVDAQIQSFFEKIGDFFPVRKQGRHFNFEAKIDVNKPVSEGVPFKQDLREFNVYLSKDENIGGPPARTRKFARSRRGNCRRCREREQSGVRAGSGTDCRACR